MHDLLTTTALSIAVTGFLVGAVVGFTGMGGGALMTPALIFLGVGNASAIVTADLTAAAVYKTGGAAMHARAGRPNFTLAGWLIAGSVPLALLGPHLVHWFAPDSGDGLDTFLKECIGFALLLAASTYAIRLYIQLRLVRNGTSDLEENPRI
ncbi:MAG: TSUP family transporter, partial [Nocardioidaceae bacterium]